MDYIKQIDYLNETSQIDMYIYSCEYLNIQSMNENTITDALKKAWTAIIEAIQTAWEWFKRNVIKAIKYLQQKLFKNKNKAKEVKSTEIPQLKEPISRKVLPTEGRTEFYRLDSKRKEYTTAIKNYAHIRLIRAGAQSMTEEELREWLNSISRATSLIVNSDAIIFQNKGKSKEILFDNIALFKDDNLDNEDKYFSEETYTQLNADDINNIYSETDKFNKILSDANKDSHLIDTLYDRTNKLAKKMSNAKNTEEQTPYFQKAVIICTKLIMETSRVIAAEIKILNSAIDYNDKFLDDIFSKIEKNDNYQYLSKNPTIEDAIKNNDKLALKTILTGKIGFDPRFETSDFYETYNYIKSRGIDLEEPYEIQEGEPVNTLPKEKWTKEYFQLNLVWLEDNFCLKKRLPIIKQIGKYTYRDKNDITFGGSWKASRNGNDYYNF